MSSPEARVRRLLTSAKKLVDPQHPLGRRALEELPALTGLSREGVSYALRHSFEVSASSAEVVELCASMPRVERAHVLLSANVFVAALRAVALGLAASERVFVRASRREPLMVRLLEEASAGAFRVVEELVPLPGDHLWAYGNDETLAALRSELAAGVVLHPHGAGMGVAVFEAGLADAAAETRRIQGAAQLLARDVGTFDQRGCLSPRLLVVKGGVDTARQLCQKLARELSAFELEVPRGDLSADESADVTRYRDTFAYAGELFFAGKGSIGLDLQPDRLVIAPVGRHLHVVSSEDPAALLGPLRSELAAVGADVGPELAAALLGALPRARHSRIGFMQRPRLDGPVDRRPALSGEVL